MATEWKGVTLTGMLGRGTWCGDSSKLRGELGRTILRFALVLMNARALISFAFASNVENGCKLTIDDDDTLLQDGISFDTAQSNSFG